MKQNKYLLIFLAFLLSPFFTKAQNQIDELFHDRVELYFKFNYHSPQELQALSKIISLDRNISDGTAFAYANKEDFKEFLRTGQDFEILPPPISALKSPKMLSDWSAKSVDEWDFYPTYEAYIAMMNQFQEDYPNLCQVSSIGQSAEGREIMVAHISDMAGLEEAEPQVLYTSTMHGNELTGFPLALRLISYLLENYGTDTEVTDLINNLDIWINPLANPDGTYAGGNHTVTGATRGNSNGVDINRNFPDPNDGPHPDGKLWQPETEVFMQFAEDNRFVLSANWHCGTEVVNYPWDTWSHLHADDDWWNFVAREWADTVHVYGPEGYFDNLDNGVTNGYDWYRITGGRQDYMNYFHQCREFTLEITGQNAVDPSELPDYWEYNYRSFLNYLKQALYGINGKVTDLQTGQPIVAEVYIENHDMDSSWVYSYASTGQYYRPIYEGNYTVTVSAPCYLSKTFSDISVSNYAATVLDVQLESSGALASFSSSQTEVIPGQSVDFTDLSCGDLTSWEWYFEGGTPATSNDQNPSGVVYSEAGVYDVSLTVDDANNSVFNLKEEHIFVGEHFLMTGDSAEVCNGLFLDSGGKNNGYEDLEDYVMTFYPGDEHTAVHCEFLSFNVEYEENCDYDWLKIYDGENIEAPLLGIFCGTELPDTITANNSSGALTFEFHSDYAETRPGWKAWISCVETISNISDREPIHFSIFPNPSSGEVFIRGQQTLEEVEVFNMTGQRIRHISLGQNNSRLDINAFPNGFYVVKITSGREVFYSKIELIR